MVSHDPPTYQPPGMPPRAHLGSVYAAVNLKPTMSSPEAKQLITTQVKAVNELHQRVLRACWDKCISRPRELDVSVGETACIDRCVPKFVEAHQLVGKELAEARGSAPLFP